MTIEPRVVCEGTGQTSKRSVRQAIGYTHICIVCGQGVSGASPRVIPEHSRPAGDNEGPSHVRRGADSSMTGGTE